MVKAEPILLEGHGWISSPCRCSCTAQPPGWGDRHPRSQGPRGEESVAKARSWRGPAEGDGAGDAVCMRRGSAHPGLGGLSPGGGPKSSSPGGLDGAPGLQRGHMQVGGSAVPRQLPGMWVTRSRLSGNQAARRSSPQGAPPPHTSLTAAAAAPPRPAPPRPALPGLGAPVPSRGGGAGAAGAVIRRFGGGGRPAHAYS